MPSLRPLVPGLLCLALLTGCTSWVPQAPAAPSATPSVTVHWEVLEPPTTPKVQRWYDTFTGDLIPGDTYGRLLPYLGSSSASEHFGTGYRYGLATWDGVVVTDPVFLRADFPTYYDPATCSTHALPMLLLQLPDTDAHGTPVRQYGLAAPDGSWYTGQVYTSTIAFSSLGALVTDQAGDVVMVDTQGQEIFRWPAQCIPLEDFQVSPYYFSITGVSGPYLCWGGSSEGEGSQYVDLRDGTVSTQRPHDYQEISLIDNGGYFPGGWYQEADGMLTIHGDDGTLHTLSLPSNLSSYTIQGDLVIWVLNENTTCQVTDLDGTPIFSVETYPLQFLQYPQSQVPTLLYYSIYAPDDPDCTTVVLDREGNPILTAENQVLQYEDRLVFATPGYYHITDLEGTDLLCLPRMDG